MPHWRIDTISPTDGLAFASLVDDDVVLKLLMEEYKDPREGREQTVFISAPRFHVQQVALGATADAAEARGFVPRLMRPTDEGLVEVEFESIEAVVEVVRRLYNGSSTYFGPEPPAAEGALGVPWAGPPLSGGGATFEETGELLSAVGTVQADDRSECVETRRKVAWLVERQFEASSFEVAGVLARCAAQTMRRGLEHRQEDEGLAWVSAGMDGMGAAMALVDPHDAKALMERIDRDFGKVLRELGVYDAPTFAVVSRESSSSAGAILERLSAPPELLGNGIELTNLKQCLTLALSDAVLMRELDQRALRTLLACAWLLASHSTRMAIPSAAILQIWRGNAVRAAARWFAQEFPVVELPDGVETLIHDALRAPLKPAYNAPPSGTTQGSGNAYGAMQTHAAGGQRSQAAGG